MRERYLCQLVTHPVEFTLPVCRMTAVATAVELLEESGLPPLCVAIAMEEDASKTLGAVLAQAVQVSFLAARNVECNIGSS